MEEIREFTSLDTFNKRELNNKEMEVQVILSELQLYLLNEKPETPFNENYKELISKLKIPTE
ncbi:hypothetical protein ACTWP4_10035 [Gracilibacillus sp. D59]|uniref:hypothetical protein n=1 Tax=Gracilibacillus sp. D59 TaxID=3457434 RepID=UPI003FCD2630